MKEIRAFIRDHRETVLFQWKKESMEMFPEQSRNVMQVKTDPFSNPIPHALGKGIEMLVGDLCEDEENNLEKGLANLGRLLGVQDMPPSQSLSFFFKLRPLVYKLASRKRSKSIFPDDELHELQLWVEQKMLRLFDQFMIHREKIYQMKGDEIKQRNYMLLRKSGQ